MEFDNIETIKRAVEINLGIALLPENNPTRSTARATQKNWDRLVRPLAIIRRKAESSAALKQFIQLLTDGT